MSKLTQALLAIAATVTLTVTGCSSNSDSDAEPTAPAGDLIIATTNFSETKILAYLYQGVLQANGVPASVKELTTREVIAPALSKGEVQLTPEYLGSVTEYLNKRVNGPDAPQIATSDAEETFAAAQGLANAENITLLTPSSAQDQNAFAVTDEFARENNLRSLSDLAEYSKDNPVTLGGPPECPQRPFCQPGLEDVYGVQLENFRPLDAGGPLTVQALRQQLIQVGLVFSSSGSVKANNLVLLDDDEGLQIAENIVPAIYTPSLTPQIEAAINEVSAALNTEELQSLNEQVDIVRRSPDEVAKEFLTEKGLL